MLRQPVARLTALAIALALALVLLLTIASPALAHPFVTDGGRVPVQSLATMTLDLAHGCGVERAGTGPDTDEVALEVPPWLRIVDVPVPDGWSVTFEDGTSGEGTSDPGPSLGTVVWTATTGAEPAPRFLLDVVVDGVAGETRYLRVSQRCGSSVERWLGTPDTPAEQPAVRLRLVPADPERPAPPLGPALEPTPGTGPSPEPVEPSGPIEPPASIDVPDVSPTADDTNERSGGRTAALVTIGGALAVAAAAAHHRRRRTA